MNTAQFQTKINGKDVIVDDQLKGYDLHKRSSTMINYVGIKEADNLLFIQFNNGKGFLYKEVPVVEMKDLLASASVGKAFHADIKSKYQGEEIGTSLIADVPNGGEDDLDEVEIDW